MVAAAAAATLAFFAALAPLAAGANVLAILTTPTKSHHIWSTPLVTALAVRGHNLTVLSPTALKKPVAGVTDLVIEGALEVQGGEFDYVEMAKLSSFDWLPSTFQWYELSCNYAINTKGVQQLMAYPDDFRFDLIIIEASGGECLLGFVEKFGRPPVVAVNGFGNPQWVNWLVGNPDHPAYVANAMLPLPQPPYSFYDTLHNSLMYALTYYLYNFRYLPSLDVTMRRHFGDKPPPIWDTLGSAELLLVNAHYSIDGARPHVPASIPIGGLHIQEPKPLPKDIKEWLDGATAGAIYFSLGSLVYSTSLSDDKRAAFLKAFSQLPKGVRVLWKWEGDAPPDGTPPNVKTAKWLPQNDILAHPNVRVFITHSGMLSTHEATWRGVPMVAVPFIVDQFLNAKRVEALGVARRLDYATLEARDVSEALNDVLTDPGYRERMQQLSSIFRSRPQHPLDTAVFWVEHVLKHKGAPRLRCATLDLPWYRLMLLDVAAVAVAALAAAITVFTAILWLLCRLCKRTPTKEKTQ